MNNKYPIYIRAYILGPYSLLGVGGVGIRGKGLRIPPPRVGTSTAAFVECKVSPFSSSKGLLEKGGEQCCIMLETFELRVLPVSFLLDP